MRSRTTAALVTGALAAALVLPAASATAATPTTDGLVISEYVEGSSFQKAIEVYNGTGGAVSLDGYELRLYSNDNGDITSPNATFAFPAASLADGDVFTVVNPSFNDDEGLVVGGTIEATSGAINHNGDDAYTLVDGGGAVVDAFKIPGADISDAANVTLRRTDLTRRTDPFSAENLDGLFDPADRGASNDVSTLGLAPGEDPPPPPPEPETCTVPDEDLTLISEIQGSDADPDARFDSPLDGQTHTIRAVVTLADPDLDGYFVQEESADDDGDPSTSEGLFVFDRRTLPVEGDTVQLTDTVTAFFGLTQFSFPDTEICDVDPITIAPTPVTLPLDRDGREALEGMLVTNAQDLEVSALFTAYRFGELGLAWPGPLVQPTSAFAPDDPAAQDLADLNDASLLKVNDRDEAFSQFNPYPWELFDEGLSAGDTMPAGRLVGAVNYSFGEFKVEPVDNEVGDPSDRIFFPETEDTAPVPSVPTLAGGNDVVAFNVLNYFNTFGDSSELRGAESQEQFDDQSAKIVDAILAMDAAVLGLIEIENDYEDLYDDDPATVPSVLTLVEQLNAVAGEGTYAAVLPPEELLTTDGFGGLGPDAIAQALIYQPAKAEPVGPTATFDIDALLTGDADNSRWPLAQTFKIDKEFVEVVVNHFKSKGSDCDDTAGPGFELGEDVRTFLTGACDLTRQYAAERLVEWVDGGATGFPTDDVLLLGDFNAYEEEAPIEILIEAGYTDLVQELGDDAFTYKFDGRYGRLDYAFASPSLLDSVTDTEVWQVNSRAPVGYLYFNDPIDLTAHASSDHDPVIVSLDSDGANGTAGNGKARGR